MRVLCVRCKGKGWCGRASCAVLEKTRVWEVKKDRFQDESFQGASPGVFVGRQGYPDVFVGILGSPDQEDPSLLDAPRSWAARTLGIPDIVDIRSSIINSRFKAGITDRSRMLDLSKEIGMTARPVDVEVNLNDRPVFRLNTDPNAAPTGPNAALKSARLISNPVVDRKVEKVVSDTDLPAVPAIAALFRKGLTEEFLTKLLSTGNVGRGISRKFVPTRWSITAVDDNIGKDLLSDVRDMPHSDPLAFFGGYLGNYYLIMFFPGVWSYELFEVYFPKVSWNTSDAYAFMTDYEPYGGRKKYAENCAGGYYAARLPMIEKLRSMKRQASVLAIRMITGEYSLPLGVWVCREAARKALSEKPILFGSDDLMLKFAQAVVRKRFGYDTEHMIAGSMLLKQRKEQSRLAEFFDSDL